jgi:hypothetical protein
MQRAGLITQPVLHGIKPFEWCRIGVGAEERRDLRATAGQIFGEPAADIP